MRCAFPHRWPIPPESAIIKIGVVKFEFCRREKFARKFKVGSAAGVKNYHSNRRRKSCNREKAKLKKKTRSEIKKNRECRKLNGIIKHEIGLKFSDER